MRLQQITHVTRNLVIGLIGLLLSFPLLAQDASSEMRIQQGYLALRNAEHAASGATQHGDNYAQRLIDIYQQQIEPYRPADLKTLYSRHDLRTLMDAADYVASYSRDPRHVADMRSALEQLQARDADALADWQGLQAHYVRLRDLDAARALALLHPGLADIPPLLAEKTLPKPWRVAFADDGTLRLTAYTPKPGYTIIAIGHPACHFSRNAVAAIEADPALREAFAGHAVWLSPQDGRLPVAMFRDWNQQHALAVMTPVWLESEWPLVDGWGTPTFYFVRDGRLISKVTGWPRAGRESELKAAIAEAAKR